jgi:hypothetical protein
MRAYGMYLPEMRPWFVGMPAKPPADEWGLAPLIKEPATRWDEEGRTEPAMLSGFPDERDP